MCTAATYKTKDFYFGRTLDYEFSYGEEIVVTPRNYPFRFRSMGVCENHYAMIGMAHVEEGYPLYYEAVNEKGLGMAGLNFVGNADYKEHQPDKDNVAVFEFIPWILGRCASVREARAVLERINLDTDVFNDRLPAAQLHWLIADRDEAITVESVKDGIHVYDNPVGVLTNNPPFDIQMFQLNNYMQLSAGKPENRFAKGLSLHTYSRGMGALGLPGDLSSGSRFVRAAFTRMNSVSGDSEEESVGQFFHILGSVDQQRGCCEVEAGKYEITIYTSCCNADKGIYYYTTYGNHQITAVNMNNENLDGFVPVRYPMLQEEQIRMQN
ncbi:MAG: choloylglycine hydrolase family protein [Lachnospiraceae bacterium]|nr:choloylglycine hydrolase family protein [Lachnospiraceae bacterium]